MKNSNLVPLATILLLLALPPAADSLVPTHGDGRWLDPPVRIGLRIELSDQESAWLGLFRIQQTKGPHTQTLLGPEPTIPIVSQEKEDARWDPADAAFLAGRIMVRVAWNYLRQQVDPLSWIWETD